jgi:SAM-dependent methyltransferase
VSSGEWEARAASFGSVADVYERSRPGYPAEAVRWLAGEPPRDVLDLGAGTGKLTRQLAAAGHRVTAVDPSLEMLDHVRRTLPDVTVDVGTAEAIPVPDAAIDVVTVGQAFHWFDHERAVPEIARVLRPGGILAVVWNARDESEPWVARLSEIIEPRGAERMPESALDAALAFGPFGPVEQSTFRFVERLERQRLLDLVASRSYCAIRPAGQRADVLGAVGALYDEVAGPDGVDLPYVTYAHRSIRSAAA